MKRWGSHRVWVKEESKMEKESAWSSGSFYLIATLVILGVLGHLANILPLGYFLVVVFGTLAFIAGLVWFIRSGKTTQDISKPE